MTRKLCITAHSGLARDATPGPEGVLRRYPAQPSPWTGSVLNVYKTIFQP